MAALRVSKVWDFQKYWSLQTKLYCYGNGQDYITPGCRLKSVEWWPLVGTTQSSNPQIVTNYLQYVHVLRCSSPTSIPILYPSFGLFSLCSAVLCPDIQHLSTGSLLSSKAFWISHLLSIRLLLISSRLLQDVALQITALYVIPV